MPSTGWLCPLVSVEELPRFLCDCSLWLLSLSFPEVEWIGSLFCDDSPLLGARMDDCGNPDCVHIVARFTSAHIIDILMSYYTLWHGDGVWD